MSTSGPQRPDPAGEHGGGASAAGGRAEGSPRRRGPRRAVRRGAEREAVLGVTEDERGGHDSNDERLRRDVPPHW